MEVISIYTQEDQQTPIRIKTKNIMLSNIYCPTVEYERQRELPLYTWATNHLENILIPFAMASKFKYLEINLTKYGQGI